MRESAGKGDLKIYELARIVQLFEKASLDEGLKSAVPAVVASSFGVYPLAKNGGSLTLACPEWVRGDLLMILEKGLGVKVCPLYFEKEIILGYITKVYLQERLVNINTFESEDFLFSANPSEIFREKKEDGDGCEMGLDGAKVLFLDISFRSVLRNIDRMEGYPFFAAGDLDVPFKRDGGAVNVFSEKLSPDTFCVVKRSDLYTGIENRHGFSEHRVDALPFSIHPTEVQMKRIEGDGTLTMNVYGRDLRIRPGERPVMGCRYYFLHFGSRYMRAIDLKVHDLWVTDRSSLAYEAEQPRWSMSDLDRWLGFDWKSGPSPAGA